MNTYKYTIEPNQSYDTTTLQSHLEANILGVIAVNGFGEQIFSISTEADKLTLDVVLETYLAQDNKAIALKLQTQNEIREEGAKQLRALVSPYSEDERATWFVQESEAKAWTQDQALGTPLFTPEDTPMLTALSTQRGIGIDILVTNIMENVTAFQAASGSILGNQQAQLDALEV